jgi:hypothetical protein
MPGTGIYSLGGCSYPKEFQVRSSVEGDWRLSKNFDTTGSFRSVALCLQDPAAYRSKQSSTLLE